MPAAKNAVGDLIRSGRLRPPEDDGDFEPPADFGIDASARLAQLRAEER